MMAFTVGANPKSRIRSASSRTITSKHYTEEITHSQIHYYCTVVQLFLSQTDSQVSTSQYISLQNHNLHTDCDGWPNGKSTPCKSEISRIYRWLVINLCRLGLGGQTVKTCIDLCMNFSSTKVNTSYRKSTQVGGQTKHKLNASQKPLARTLYILLWIR